MYVLFATNAIFIITPSEPSASVLVRRLARLAQLADRANPHSFTLQYPESRELERSPPEISVREYNSMAESRSCQFFAAYRAWTPYHIFQPGRVQ
jgi:hypothetical protein